MARKHYKAAEYFEIGRLLSQIRNRRRDFVASASRCAERELRPLSRALDAAHSIAPGPF